MAKKLVGVVGIYSDPDQLMKAARTFKDARVKKMDAFTPFPVHGMEDAIGIPRSKIPWVTFLAGLTGLTIGFSLQTWVATMNWKLNVGGKPFFSFPAFIPVMFELTVLIAGLSTAGALFALTGMPNFKPQIIDPEITNDKFALFVSSDDPNYKESEFMNTMKSTGAIEVKVLK